jgi:hypothetical protein
MPLVLEARKAARPYFSQTRYGRFANDFHGRGIPAPDSVLEMRHHCGVWWWRLL